MKLEQSQLDYLKERSGNYDRKYRMFEILLSRVPNRLNTVVELFGGIGIQTHYISKTKEVGKHISIDVDKSCNIVSKLLNPNVERIEANTFEFKYKDKIDLLVCDGTFNNSSFEKLTELVNRFDFDNLILTNTGVFNVRFNKDMTYEQYWENMRIKLEQKGLLLTDVVFSFDFGLMLIRKTNINNARICLLEKGDISTDWRSYRDSAIKLLENN